MERSTSAAATAAWRLLQRMHLGSDLAWQMGQSTGKEQLLQHSMHCTAQVPN